MGGTEQETNPEYWVRLEVFEGPLDLLLHIIRKHELDILDIPVAFVLERYLAYLETMRELELDVASEYLAMAATLVYIKSRMLLPDTGEEEEEEEDGEVEDPRAELIRRLLEYKKYRKAAADLASQSMLGRDVFEGGFEADPVEREVAEVGLFELIECVGDLIREARAVGRDDGDLLADRITVAQRITELAEMVSLRRNVTFRQLLDDDFLVFDVVITFLAILEMARLHMIQLVQSGPTEQLLILEAPRYQGEELGEEEPDEDETAEEPDEGDAGAEASREAPQSDKEESTSDG